MEELIQKIRRYIAQNDTLNWGNLSAMEITEILMRCVLFGQCPLSTEGVICDDFTVKDDYEYENCCENCVHWNQDPYICKKVSDRIHQFNVFKYRILRTIIENDLKNLVYGWVDYGYTTD